MDLSLGELEFGFKQILYCTLIILTSVIIKNIFTWIRAAHVASNIPYPEKIKPSFFVGHGHLFTDNKLNSLHIFQECMQGKEPIYKIRMFHKYFFLLRRPEDYEIILSSNIKQEKGQDLSCLVQLITNSKITFTDPEWRSHESLKRVLSLDLESNVKIFANKANLMLKHLLECTNGTTLEVFVINSNFDAFVETITGLSSNFQKGYRTMPNLDRPYEITSHRVFNPILTRKFIFRWTQFGMLTRKYSKFINIIKEYFDKELLQRYKGVVFDGFRDTDDINSIVSELIKEHVDATLDVDTDDIRNTLIILLFTGFQSTSTMCMFTLLMLAMHPDIQENVYKEIKKVLGESEDIEYMHTTKMNYLDLVLKETLRLFPVHPFILKKINQDVKLGKYTVPKESQVVLMTIDTQRSSRYFKNPLKFLPERFAKGFKNKSRHSYSYLPFSQGSRACIGEKFGLTNVKTYVATVVRKCHLTTEYKSVEEVKLKYNIFTRPVNGYRINTKVRDAEL